MNPAGDLKPHGGVSVVTAGVHEPGPFTGKPEFCG